MEQTKNAALTIADVKPKFPGMIAIVLMLGGLVLMLYTFSYMK